MDLGWCLFKPELLTLIERSVPIVRAANFGFLWTQMVRLYCNARKGCRITIWKRSWGAHTKCISKSKRSQEVDQISGHSPRHRGVAGSWTKSQKLLEPHKQEASEQRWNDNPAKTWQNTHCKRQGKRSNEVRGYIEEPLSHHFQRSWDTVKIPNDC